MLELLYIGKLDYLARPNAKRATPVTSDIDVVLAMREADKVLDRATVAALPVLPVLPEGMVGKK